MLDSNYRSLKNYFIFALFLLTLGMTRSLAAEACQPLTEPGKAALTSYIQKKYKLVNVPVTIAEDSLVADTCYRELKFRSPSPQRPFAITLYLAPDQKYLMPELLDLRVDPAEQERKKNQAVLETLTQGSFASHGPTHALVTIVEFGDFQCPYCSRASEMVKAFLATPEAKNVRFIYRHFPLSFHPWARPAAEAAACVNFQGAEKFWALHNWIFENQKAFTAENAQQKLLEGVQAVPGLDLNAYQNCVDNAMSAGIVQKDLALGNASAVHGTPTFFINGRQIPGIRSADDLRTLVAQAQQESCPDGKCAAASASATPVGAGTAIGSATKASAK